MTAPKTNPRVRILTISPGQEGQRLDNYLITQLKGVPRSRVYNLVRRGEVRINMGRVAPGYRLRSGDKVRVPPVRTAPPRAAEGGGSAQREFEILFEDEYLLVLNKPAGLAVHAGSGVRSGLIEMLRDGRSDAPFLELAHRLDRDTSGCLLVAKRRDVLVALHDALRRSEGRSQDIRKYYLALVTGRWEHGTRSIVSELRKNRLRGGERVSAVAAGGREAESRFRPVKILGRASLVEIELRTGRTHQARVHAAQLGHPVAGDRKYGDKARNSEMRRYGLRRMFLHAQRLRFRHPVTGVMVDTTAPLPADLAHVIEKLEHEHAV